MRNSNLPRSQRLWFLWLGLLPSLLIPTTASADWQQAQRQTIAHGVQAMLMCNGLFTSHRALELIFEQELKYLAPPRFEGPRGTASWPLETRHSRNGALPD